MERLAKLAVGATLIKLAYKAFNESVIAFNLAIIYKHLSADDIKALNRQIRVAYKLSGDKTKM